MRTLVGLWLDKMDESNRKKNLQFRHGVEVNGEVCFSHGGQFPLSIVKWTETGNPSTSGRTHPEDLEIRMGRGRLGVCEHYSDIDSI